MRRRLRIWLPAVRAGSGADVFMQRLADGLERAGHEPLPQWFAHSREWQPWRLLSVEPPANVDIVHAGSWQGFAFRRRGVPLVVTEHQYIQHPAFMPHRRMLQSLYHAAFVRHCVARSYQVSDALVAVSEHTAQAMRADLDRSVHVIHNWVDTSRFAPAPDSQREAGAPFRLLFVGNPSRWKGADVLPALAERLGPAFEIQCIGGLRRPLDSAKMPRGIHALASVDASAKPSIYHSVDAVLVPTRYEAFGYVAVEAKACGLPVLGFASTGTAEVCVHEETALLVPMDDVDALARQARRLASDSALCRRLGEAGRRRVLACFSERQGISAYLALYETLIANEGAPQ